MASLKRKQTLFSGVARKAKEIRQNSTNLAFDNKTNARKGSKIATADARLAIYVFYLSMDGPAKEIWELLGPLGLLGLSGASQKNAQKHVTNQFF